MKCPRCGNELKDGMLFCEHCGEEIRIVQDFEPEMEMNMETFSTETFSVEEDFPMDEILSDRMESARPKDAGGRCLSCRKWKNRGLEYGSCQNLPQQRAGAGIPV